MPKLTSERAVSMLELQQLVADYFWDLDEHGGVNCARFFTEDCTVGIGAMVFNGSAALTDFYEGLIRHVRESDPMGQRTTRHAFTNFRCAFDSDDRATVDILAMNYSASGAPPLADATTPTVVSDARFVCTRDGEGGWRIADFTGGVVFLGNDPVQNKVLMGE